MSGMGGKVLFRVDGKVDWYAVDYVNGERKLLNMDHGKPCQPTYDDIIATDWVAGELPEKETEPTGGNG